MDEWMRKRCERVEQALLDELTSLTPEGRCQMPTRHVVGFVLWDENGETLVEWVGDTPDEQRSNFAMINRTFKEVC